MKLHRRPDWRALPLIHICAVATAAAFGSSTDTCLPGTQALVMPADVVKEQLQQVYDYFGRRITEAQSIRDRTWNVDFRSATLYAASVAPFRKRCREMLGLADVKGAPVHAHAETLKDGVSCRVERISVEMVPGLSARGLLVTPAGSVRHPLAIACPDADVWPERFAGLEGAQRAAPWLTDLLEHGVAVYIPQSIERMKDHPYCQTTNDKDRRHILYRLGYVVGRTMPGLDVQDALAAVDFLAARPDIDSERIAIMGIGQGGMTAMYAAALEPRLTVVIVADYFQKRDQCWQEPVDRRLPAQLLTFGDAEIAALIAPRRLHLIGRGSPNPADLNEFNRAQRFYDGLKAADRLQQESANSGQDVAAMAASRLVKIWSLVKKPAANPWPSSIISNEAATAIRNQHFEEKLAYLRGLIDASQAEREKRWRLTQRPASEFPAIKKAMLEDYRQLVGEVPSDGTPLNPRSELILITDKFRAYRVMLDLVAGVQVYGHLLIPRGLTGRTPAVICQHGLSGQPEMISGIGWKEDTVYHEFGRRLAEHGYVVFAPLLLHRDPAPLTDEQSRKADAVGMMRIAMPIAKTRRVVEFLRTLPQVNPDRIGYYGLSYGGYSAIWIPPLVESLALTVISGHFNDWQEKITSDSEGTSYLKNPYEDFYNWDILHRFTHLELISMIAPRPVCIEFGEHDPITTPRWTARAWEQVCAIRDHLGLANQITLAHFEGVHEIHGVESFDFLDRFLRPQQPVGRDYEYTILGGAYDWSSANPVKPEPFVTVNLEAVEHSRLEGRCWMPAGARDIRGLAVKLSRDGEPGPIELRLGTAPGRDDLGTTTMTSQAVLPLYEQWYELHIPPKELAAGTIIYWTLSCRSGSHPGDHYVVYGPRPIGGTDDPHRFGLSYRLLTDRPGDSIHSADKQQRFEFAVGMLQPFYATPPSMTAHASARGDKEMEVTSHWTIRYEPDPDDVTKTAAGDLQQFFEACAHLRLDIVDQSDGDASSSNIELILDHDKTAFSADESYRVDVQSRRIVISGLTPRSIMRGVYWVEDMMRIRGGPILTQGATLRQCRFDRRLTSSIVPSDVKYEETSHPMLYTDGLLQRISHQGFNGLWVWLNAEEVTLESKVFPELNDPEAAVRFARLSDLVRRAKPYGIDVYCYYATNYHHPVPPAFYEKHPEARGVGWGNAMCTSNEQVRAYHADNVRTLVRHVPGLKGLVVIFDSEGFFYCGSTEATREACPQCRKRTCVDIATELVGVLNDALHTGNPDRKLILWPYGHDSGEPDNWVMHLVPQLPKDVIFQILFSKGDRVVRDGIEHITGDYNITTVGPQVHFQEMLDAARNAGLTVLAKTEHAISQEFVFVPYIPCMQQWDRRAARMADFPLSGLFCNWAHYGYTPSPTAEILMWDSWTQGPPIDKLLLQMATRDFGAAAAPHVVSAWSHFTKGIEQFPYSDPVVRTPGPLQKGPSQPLFLDPKIPGFGAWRAWQNDLKWTDPWGPKIAGKYLGLVEQEFDAGLAELQTAGRLCDADRRPAFDKEVNIARAIRASLHTVLNLLAWLPVRDEYAQSSAGPKRDKLRERLIEIAHDELTSAREILPMLESDSRIGFSETGQHAGLFTPGLVRIKIGMLEDLLERELAPMKTGE